MALWGEIVRISVVGLGYVGLVTAVGFAKWGHQVTGVEADKERLLALLSGSVPFFEPHLAGLVRSECASGRLRFAASTREGINRAQLVFTAVGTDDGHGGWQTDTMSVCLEEVVPSIADDAALVVRSTLPPDFVRRMPTLVNAIRVSAGKPDVPVFLNPEFTREGQALQDFLTPERVVIGIGDDPSGKGTTLLKRAYKSANAPILEMGAVDACFAKLGANLFLATKISFANELAALCDAHGADINSVVGAMALDSRIGGKFLRAGIGFGGSCLPHQVTMTAEERVAADVGTPLMQAVRRVNDEQPQRLVDRLRAILGGTLAGKSIAMLGLTFKPETDDVREAPALRVAEILLSQGADIVAYDPMVGARSRAQAIVPGLRVAASARAALTGADAAALVTEWREFLELDWTEAAEWMKTPAIVDGRNALDPAEMLRCGFRYAAFGRRIDLDGTSPHRSFRIEPTTIATKAPRGNGLPVAVT